MNIRTVEDLIFDNFPFTPTEGQRILILALAEFILNRRKFEVFLFKGYAGTGKTTLLSAFVKAAPQIGIKTVLLAPTGRAAKVLASYSGKQAFTIHKKIYQPRTSQDGSIVMHRTENLHKNTIFIVDEASMIPGNKPAANGQFITQSDLLTDLIEYVHSGWRCSLLLIGDIAQLPPVGLDVSPAMDYQYLTTAYHLTARKLELTEVMRQSMDSGILVNATKLRLKLQNQDYHLPLFNINHFTDIVWIDHSQLEDELMSAHSVSGDDKAIVITRSNKRANIYNHEIRNRILFREDEIAAGDYMMVVKNNYFWLPSDSKAGFIANGDIFEVLKIKRIEDIYSFKFADAIIRLTDYPDEPELEVKLLLDTIESESASLSYADSQRLFDEISQDYDDIPSRRRRAEKVKNNPYFNALQVKFAYALTCHKTQGGQWETIFIDQPYIPNNKIDRSFLRWMYTAITRATKKVYLINFAESFFE
jgi:exodeoxyribonuclease-5